MQKNIVIFLLIASLKLYAMDDILQDNSSCDIDREELNLFGKPPSLKFVAKYVGNSSVRSKEVSYSACSCNELSYSNDGECGYPPLELNRTIRCTNEVTQIAFSDDGNYMLTFSAQMRDSYPYISVSRIIRKWNLNTGEYINITKTPNDLNEDNLLDIIDITDQFVTFTECQSNSIKVFDLKTKTVIDNQNLNKKSPETSAFSKDYKYIAKTNYIFDCEHNQHITYKLKVSLWDTVKSDIKILSPLKCFYSCDQLKFSPKSNKLVGSGENGLFLYDIPSGKLIFETNYLDLLKQVYSNIKFDGICKVSPLIFSTDESYLIGLFHSLICFWDCNNGDFLGYYTMEKKQIRTINIDYKNNLLAVATEQDTVYLYKLV